ncbi:MAG TPA: BTAD domain-containing putative transcriptional regulator [Longimicrobiales bacterium]|nr:BTAD domain-containing putative transcriptional regulator [Longimicrobiales bacterium]
MSIRITTLGRVQVTRGDAVIAALPSQRLRCALLVYLAVTRDTTRDRLLALFWPEREEPRARHALSQNIYELRSVLGEDWITLRGEQISVAPHVTVDVLAFGEAADSGDAQTAVSMYRGPFLDGFYIPGASGFEAWMENQRLRAHRQHRRARRDWITRLVDQARIREAVQVARDWVTLDPGDDEAQHLLIELLADTGDRSGAIGQYESYTKLLMADDLEPLEETRLLVERIREGDVGALPSPPVPLGARAAPPAPARPAAPARPEGGSMAVAAPAGAAPPRKTPADEESERQRVRRTMVVLAAVLLLALTSFLATRPQPVGDVNRIAPQRLAVLYFDDRSPDGSGGPLSRSLTESLISAFGEHRPALDVVDRHVVAMLNGSRPDSAARVLGADMLLSGWITRADGIVRVNVELHDSAGDVVSSDAVTVEQFRYIELVDSLVSTVSFVMRQRMGVHLTRQRLTTYRAGNATWAAVLKAREMELEARPLMVPGTLDEAALVLARADSILAAAEKAEPRWATPALGRVPLAEMMAAIELQRADTTMAYAWLERAAAHATRVIERQPEHARAHELRGGIRMRQMFTNPGRETSETLVQQAFRDLQYAASLEPTPQAFAQLARQHYTQGNFGMALRTAERASKLDTYHFMHRHILYTRALSEFEVGDDSTAARMCGEGLRQYRDHMFAYCALTVMAWSESEPADPDSAWAVASTPREQVDPMLQMLVAATLARAGLADSAAAVLDRTTDRHTISGAVRWIEPAVRYRLGQHDSAVAQFDGFLAEQPRRLGNANMRALAPLRSARRTRPLETEDRRIR